jgi:hypothetical protein
LAATLACSAGLGCPRLPLAFDGCERSRGPAALGGFVDGEVDPIEPPIEIGDDMNLTFQPAVHHGAASGNDRFALDLMTNMAFARKP